MRGTDRRVVLGLYRSDHRRALLEAALSTGINALDTAYNYLDFGSHRMLARCAADLLPCFEISTKVGFFRCDGAYRHSLEPEALRDAVRRSVDELGVLPAVVFLHSPERTVAGLDLEHAHAALSAACAALAEMRDSGFFNAWGIASWDPAPLLPALQEGSDCPTPDVVMVRSGLALDGLALNVIDQFVEAQGVGPGGVWGMSPFGGIARSFCSVRDISALLAPGQRHTPVQAAFRIAFDLPPVGRIAVGTGDVGHLRELYEATSLRVSPETVRRYRRLIGSLHS